MCIFTQRAECASHITRHYGRHLRLESSKNALSRGRRGISTCSGRPPSDKMPCWSSQFGPEARHSRGCPGVPRSVIPERKRRDAQASAPATCDGGSLIALDTVIPSPRTRLTARKAHPRTSARHRQARGCGDSSCADHALKPLAVSAAPPADHWHHSLDGPVRHLRRLHLRSSRERGLHFMRFETQHMSRAAHQGADPRLAVATQRGMGAPTRAGGLGLAP